MTIEHAREGIEHAHHASAHPAGGNDRFNRYIALLIAGLAATLALAEMAERSAQSRYMAHHIAVSNHWVFFGFKSTRARIVEQTATMLSLRPDADSDPKVKAAIEDARKTSRRMREGEGDDPGTRQIEQQARHEIVERDHANHEYHLLEFVTSALQIAIVLASVSVVTRVRLMAAVGGAMGLAAAVAGLLIKTGVI